MTVLLRSCSSAASVTARAAVAHTVQFGELISGCGRCNSPDLRRLPCLVGRPDRRTGGPLTKEHAPLGAAIMFEIPVPLTRWPAMRLHNLLMLGSLPRPVRELYELEWTPAHAAVRRAALAGLRATRPITPATVRHGRNTLRSTSSPGHRAVADRRGRPVPGALA